MSCFRVIFLTVFSLIFFCKIFSAPLNVQVDAESAILINAQTGAILFEKNAYQPMYPASLTKVVTAWYALEKMGFSLDEQVVVQDEQVKVVPVSHKRKDPAAHPSHRLEYGGTMIGLKAGDQIAFRHLLTGLMLCSGNDAANVIASHISGSVQDFMNEVNAHLQKHDLTNTYFTNPHGLHDEAHTTTPYDLAKITSIAIKNPVFRELVSTKKAVRPAYGNNPQSYFIQSNRLLKPGQFYYPKALGVKTGYHSKAGFNLIAAAEDKGRLLIAVLMKAKDSESRYRDAINLFEAAFKETKVMRVLLAKNQDVFRRKVKDAKKTLEAVLKEDLTLTYYPSEEPQMKASLLWKDVPLPIKKDTVVGDMVISAKDGSILTKAPVYAVADVQKTPFAAAVDCAKAHNDMIFANKVLLTLSITFVILIGLLLWHLRKKTPVS